MDKILLDALASSGIVFNSESEANAAAFEPQQTMLLNMVQNIRSWAAY